MRARRIRTYAATGIMVVTAGAWPVLAGDLFPPIGPIAPTMKTLTEVEPRIAISSTNTPGDADSVFKITEGGGYYLSGNVIGEPGKFGIEVFTADHVTIDLNGYALLGVPGSLNGIGGFANAIIRNGAASGWGGDGIHVSRGIIDHVHVSNNGQNGIRGAWGNVITDCDAEANGSAGISVGDVSRIHGCVSKGNMGKGIMLDGVVVVTECVIYANQAGGIRGGLATIQDCVLFSNTGAAIEVIGFSVVRNNNMSANGTGVLASGNGNHIEGNSAFTGGVGFDIDGTENFVIRNTARGNLTDFDIAAGNAHGPIVNVTGVGDISATVGADHPWANFRH
jgi:hypothetical protein